MLISIEKNITDCKRINRWPYVCTGCNKKSIYQITIENKNEINKSITTIYRYINNGYLTTKIIDLPYAVTYKKRKHNNRYDYSNNKIDRTGHTYLDYLSYLHKHPVIKNKHTLSM